jgi:glycosyltransferase involved in cell wall biosynthesis
MRRPLRFCMITTFYPPYNFGGDGVFVHRLSNELARRGHDVDVIHCTDSYRLLARREPDEPYDDHPNVTVHGLRSPFGFLSPLATQQTGSPVFKSKEIRRILAKGFDVIHFHNISLIGGPRVLEYGQGVKLYTMHEYWLHCPTHVLFKFNETACTERACLRCSVVYKRPPQLWRYGDLVERMAKQVDTFIAPSDFSAESHRQNGLNGRIVRIPYFLPSTEVATPPSEEPAEPYFLFVGRLEKLKGLQTLIPIFRRYQKARLVVAGKGDFEPQLRALAAGASNIRFVGHQPQPRLQALYRGAVALIVPSLCFEVFPLVIIEAFAQRTPAIVRNLGGMPGVIRESGGGFTYNTDAELTAALDRLLGDPSHRDHLGQRGYQTYQQEWSAEPHLRRYFALIEEIAATRGQSLS